MLSDEMTTVVADLPTVYSDLNVFRYVACGEMMIDAADCFRWVYSHVHLDEIRRSENRDALAAIRQLAAVELQDVLDNQFRSTGTVMLKDYIDPDLRYKQHLQAVSGYEGAGDSLIEMMLRLHGADNYQEVQNIPRSLVIEVDTLTVGTPPEARDSLMNRAKDVAAEMDQMIPTHLKERRSLDQLRAAFGLTSEDRRSAGSSPSPIDALLGAMDQVHADTAKSRLFDLKSLSSVLPGASSQDTAIAGAYTVLNIFGLSADKHLARRDGLIRTMSDSHHVGMASYCDMLLSADRRLCDKARALYAYFGAATRVVHFEYKAEGFTLTL